MIEAGESVKDVELNDDDYIPEEEVEAFEEDEQIHQRKKKI